MRLHLGILFGWVWPRKWHGNFKVAILIIFITPISLIVLLTFGGSEEGIQKSSSDIATMHILYQIYFAPSFSIALSTPPSPKVVI